MQAFPSSHDPAFEVWLQVFVPVSQVSVVQGSLSVQGGGVPMSQPMIGAQTSTPLQ